MKLKAQLSYILITALAVALLSGCSGHIGNGSLEAAGSYVPLEFVEDIRLGETVALAGDNPLEAVPMGAPTTTHTPFSFNMSDIEKFYARSYTDYTYTHLTPERAREVLPLIWQAGKAQGQELMSGINQAGYFIQLKSGEKFSYALIPNAVRIGNDSYPISDETYNTLLSIAQQTMSEGNKYIQWLVYMSPEKVQSIDFQTSTDTAPRKITGSNVSTAAAALANIQVKSGSAYPELEELAHVKGSTYIQFNFESGVSYQVYIKKGTLNIQSSDMTYGCSYQLQTSQRTIEKKLNELAQAASA